MLISALEWDDENISHIARHNVTPKEVEDVYYGIHLCIKDGDQRYILSGQSIGSRYP